MKTMLNLKIDKDVKEKARKVAETMGIPLGTVANILLRQFARDKEIRVYLAESPSKYLRDSIKESEKEYKRGKLKEYTDVKEMLKDLTK